MSADWDYTHQRAETALSVESLLAETELKPGVLVTLDLEFAPAEPSADRSLFEKSLKSFGYIVGTAETEGHVAASLAGVPFTIEDIWTHEERTTRLALSRGFVPEGWGFWEPGEDEDTD